MNKNYLTEIPDRIMKINFKKGNVYEAYASGSFSFKKIFLYNFNGYFLFIVILKYWLYFSCCPIIHPCSQS